MLIVSDDMSRAEFSKETKRAALKRSGKRCEASGVMYGLPPDHRCSADLSFGVEFDHIIADGISSDNSLENCACVCIKCHRYKSSKHDVPKIAKMKRQRDKNNGIAKPKRRLQSRKFGYQPSYNVRDINDE